MGRFERCFWLMVLATAAVAIPGAMMLGCGDAPAVDATAVSEIADGGVEKTQIALSCLPSYSCSTLGTYCDWGTSPSSHQTYFLHAIDGGNECRAVAWPNNTNIADLRAVFTDNTIIAVKTGSASEADLYSDLSYTGNHCHIPPGWAGSVVGTTIGLRFYPPQGCDTYRFDRNGITSLKAGF